jgi:ATP-dependent helicase HepA
VSSHVGQVRGCRGLSGLLSSRIDLLRHQAEVVRRVLQDPLVRYLLANEAGLGKTIEAGVILRQLPLDWPPARFGVFVPTVLRQQWRGELAERFELGDVPVWGHEELIARPLPAPDVAVIDEAHWLEVARGRRESFRHPPRGGRSLRAPGPGPCSRRSRSQH